MTHWDHVRFIHLWLTHWNLARILLLWLTLWDHTLSHPPLADTLGPCIQSSSSGWHTGTIHWAILLWLTHWDHASNHPLLAGTLGPCIESSFSSVHTGTMHESSFSGWRPAFISLKNLTYLHTYRTVHASTKNHIYKVVARPGASWFMSHFSKHQRLHGWLAALNSNYPAAALCLGEKVKAGCNYIVPLLRKLHPNPETDHLEFSNPSRYSKYSPLSIRWRPYQQRCLTTIHCGYLYIIIYTKNSYRVSI